MAASSLQYITPPTGYHQMMPSDSAEQYLSGGGATLQLQQHPSMHPGMQKLVVSAAGQPRPMTQQAVGQTTTLYHSGVQKLVAVQPMAIANGAQRTYAGGTTYLHQAAPHPRPQQLPAGTQIINAFNAEGQPVAIAINPNGTHSILSPATTTMQQPMQQLQMRQVPATTLITSQGQRIVQLPSGEFQALQSGGAPGIYKVVQQGTPMQTGDRYLVQAGQSAAPGMQVAVQRFMPSNGAVPMNPSGMPQLAMRPQHQQPVASMMAQPGGIQMGRSLIHMPSTPATAFTPGTTQMLRPNPNVVAMAKPQPPKQVIKQVQPMQLPSAILVKPAGSADSGLSQVLQQQAGAAPGMQPQSLQQQVKDTAAQQRQQQLLASLRARVASLHNVQGGQAVMRPGSAQPVQATTMGPGGQIRRMGGSGDQVTGAPATTAMHLQPDAAGASSQGMPRLGGMVMSASGQQLSQTRGLMDGPSLTSLPSAQHQAMMSGLPLDHQLLMGGHNSDPQAMMARHLADNQSVMAGQTLDRQALAAHQQIMMLRESLPTTTGLASTASSDEVQSQGGAPGRLVLLPGPPASLGAPSPTFTPIGPDGKAMQRHSLMQPLSPNGVVGKEDLRIILLSIGVELARHGIDVKTAVEAGWLGVLSPTDVEVLQEAYTMEEHRLVSDSLAGGMDERRGPPTDAASVHGAPASVYEAASTYGASSTSRGSPAASVVSGAGGLGGGMMDMPNVYPSTGLERMSPQVNDVAHITDIDDARFSAFAYDFFGGQDNGGLIEGESCLESLEPDRSGVSSGDASLTNSMMRPVATRAPSWPPAATNSQTGPLQTDESSMGCFSDMCPGAPATHHTNDSDNVSTSSSNHELVARIANLDLGCGFY